ncbi:TetR/AcrR family transcriptional regulator C-terminal domain-containing protein [Dactylosporangium sp. NPDC000555]|uniref:TetR/AcrR family transcriptional regulator n=1 Tax=Dactylosporangium sp. NPDC000555 TaxID=3154260 RepID=UPI003333FE27
MTPTSRRGSQSDVSPRRSLSRETIVSAALEILDSDGLSSLSMRKLGAVLGVDPMSVYYYLPNKAALYDGVVDAILRELGWELSQLEPHAETTERLAALLRTYRQVLKRHPHALPVVSTRPVRSPHALVAFDRILSTFIDAGFDLRGAVIAMTTAVEFTIGHVTAEAAEPYGGETPYSAEALEGLDSVIPVVFQAWQVEVESDELFEAGLIALLEGLQRRYLPATG